MRLAPVIPSLPTAEVGRLVGVSVPTVRSWRGRYLTGGLVALADLPRSGWALLHDQEHTIAVTVEPPAGRARGDALVAAVAG